MRWLTLEDLDDLALGGAILGSGGGGNCFNHLLIAKFFFDRYGPVKLISVNELKQEDVVLPLALIATPLVIIERLPNGKEMEALVHGIQKHLQKYPTVLMTLEMGGCNAFAPILAAAQTGLPVLDADMMGRAFPEIQMCSGYLKKVKSTPAIMVDDLGNEVIIHTTTTHKLESLARFVTVGMGSCANISCYIMDGNQAFRSTIPGTLSKALHLGHLVHQALKNGKNFIEALVDQAHGIFIGEGMIIDIDQSVEHGFLKGTATISNHKKTFYINYQNEYLSIKEENTVRATTPDIITLFDAYSGMPVETCYLSYGLEVIIMAFPAPDIWQTVEGLAVVGPKVFGYNVNYVPVDRRQKGMT